MSKTSQRKQAAFESGAKDGFEGRPRKKVDRSLKESYNSAYDAGRADRRRSKLTPEARAKEHEEYLERRREWGPEPTQY
jgi:hypothetical protein